MRNHQISDDQVREELKLILEFEEIKNSHVLCRFIEFVVEKKLSGQEDEIKEYTIAVNGLGKPRDYKPQLDASVRIHAGRLRRLLTQYYRTKGINDAVLIDIPKGTYVPVFTNRSNEDRNGDRLQLSQQQDVDSPKTVGSVYQLSKKAVLAILPFHNMSPEHSEDYFVTGLGEQLSTAIARFQRFSVISYFTTSGYKADLNDLQYLKEKIHLDLVLTGSVRFTSEMIKINIQLIDTITAEMVFTDTFSRQLLPEKLSEMQDEIIDQISNIIADHNGIIVNLGYYSDIILNKRNSAPPSAEA